MSKPSLLILLWAFIAGAVSTTSSSSFIGPLSPCYYGPDNCICAPGTSYAVSKTTQTLGSSARNFRDIVGNWFDLSWQPLPQTILRTTGRRNAPGATRTESISVGGQNYTFTERLTRYEARSDGGFSIFAELANGPVPYRDGSGSFGGYWGQFQGFATAGERESVFVDWKITSCLTGEPFDWTEFKEGSLTNVARILRERGQLRGTMFDAVTDESL